MSERPNTGALNAKSETCPACGTMLKTGDGGNVPSRVVSVSVPSCVSIGHDGNGACGHFGVASGLDTRPGGRSTRTFLTLPSGSRASLC